MPVGGGFDTPQAASFSVGEGKQYTVTGMSVNRYVHDPSDGWVHSRWISPLGASGHPGSTHYADQVPAIIYCSHIDRLRLGSPPSNIIVRVCIYMEWWTNANVERDTVRF